MASCLAINPSQLAVKRGLSYYGTQHTETIVPYSLAERPRSSRFICWAGNAGSAGDRHESAEVRLRVD